MSNSNMNKHDSSASKFSKIITSSPYYKHEQSKTRTNYLLFFSRVAKNSGVFKGFFKSLKPNLEKHTLDVYDIIDNKLSDIKQLLFNTKQPVKNSMTILTESHDSITYLDPAAKKLVSEISNTIKPGEVVMTRIRFDDKLSDRYLTTSAGSRYQNINSKIRPALYIGTIFENDISKAVYIPIKFITPEDRDTIKLSSDRFLKLTDSELTSLGFNINNAWERVTPVLDFGSIRKVDITQNNFEKIHPIDQNGKPIESTRLSNSRLNGIQSQLSNILVNYHSQSSDDIDIATNSDNSELGFTSTSFDDIPNSWKTTHLNYSDQLLLVEDTLKDLHIHSTPASKMRNYTKDDLSKIRYELESLLEDTHLELFDILSNKKAISQIDRVSIDLYNELDKKPDFETFSSDLLDKPIQFKSKTIPNDRKHIVKLKPLEVSYTYRDVLELMQSEQDLITIIQGLDTAESVLNRTSDKKIFQPKTVVDKLSNKRSYFEKVSASSNLSNRLKLPLVNTTSILAGVKSNLEEMNKRSVYVNEHNIDTLNPAIHRLGDLISGSGSDVYTTPKFSLDTRSAFAAASDILNVNLVEEDTIVSDALLDIIVKSVENLDDSEFKAIYGDSITKENALNDIIAAHRTPDMLNSYVPNHTAPVEQSMSNFNQQSFPINDTYSFDNSNSYATNVHDVDDINGIDNLSHIGYVDDMDSLQQMSTDYDSNFPTEEVYHDDNLQNDQQNQHTDVTSNNMHIREDQSYDDFLL